MESPEDDVVRDALLRFIRRELVRALGAEFADDFAPRRTTTLGLLQFIESKWLGVFNDTLTQSDQQTLLETSRVLKRRGGVLTAELAERCLVAIGASGKAATVASVAHGSASHASYGPYGPRAGQNGQKTDTRHPTAATATATANEVDEDAAMQDADPIPGAGAPINGTRAGTAADNSCSPYTYTNVGGYGVYGMQNGNGSGNGDASMLDVEEVLPEGLAGLVPVVLDGANIGWGGGGFRIRRAATALAYFQRLGHPCTLVLPESRLQRASGGERDGEALRWVLQHQGTAALVATPDADYDDVYITHLGRRHAAVVVSNDKFRDVVDQAKAADGRTTSDNLRQYFTMCRCSFAFHGNAFVPNPAFCFIRAREHARNYALTPD